MTLRVNGFTLACGKNYTILGAAGAKTLTKNGRLQWHSSCIYWSQTLSSRGGVMRKWICNLFLALTVGLGLIGCGGLGEPPVGSTDASSRRPPFTESQPLTVPAGTEIYVRLQQPLSSATAQAGQSFSAVLDQPLIVDNQTAASPGVAVTGKVIAVRDSGHLPNAGYLRLSLVSITLNGKELPLVTNSVFVGGGSFRKRNFAFIGSGRGSAMIGALADSGKGSGSPAGAAGGTTPAYAPGKKDAGFAAEQRLGFRLTQPLDVNQL
jgi:hypothetical protein